MEIWPTSKKNRPKILAQYLFYCVNTSYLVDRCICPALCLSHQTLEKYPVHSQGGCVASLSVNCTCVRMCTSSFCLARSRLNAWKVYRFICGFFISKQDILQQKWSIRLNNIYRSTFCLLLLARIADRVGILL